MYTRCGGALVVFQRVSQTCDQESTLYIGTLYFGKACIDGRTFTSHGIHWSLLYRRLSDLDLFCSSSNSFSFPQASDRVAKSPSHSPSLPPRDEAERSGRAKPANLPKYPARPCNCNTARVTLEAYTGPNRKAVIYTALEGSITNPRLS